MAEEIDFKIPMAEDVAKETKKDLEAKVEEVSKSVREAIDLARSTDTWPAELSKKKIPSELENPLYEYLTSKAGYNIDRQTEHWYISKPTEK